MKVKGHDANDRPMTSRERFLRTMQYAEVDRAPCFDEGLRPEVIVAWKRQGLADEEALWRTVAADKRETLETDLYPIPDIEIWPSAPEQLAIFEHRLDPLEENRMPKGFSEKIDAWRSREHALMMYVHQGFFLSMGVEDWRRFREVMYLLVDEPALVRNMMRIQGEFAARLADRVLREVDVDAAVFSEPIGGNDQPLLSPAMYEEIVLESYAPVFEVLHRHDVAAIIFQTYANARILIPLILKWGFNCLWSCEAETEAMDYRGLRKEYGRDLRLMGGIDLDVIRLGEAAIRRELETKVPPLLASGGYVPLADGRMRADMPLANYLCYRKLLEEIVRGSF